MMNPELAAAEVETGDEFPAPKRFMPKDPLVADVMGGIRRASGRSHFTVTRADHTRVEFAGDSMADVLTQATAYATREGL